MAGYYCKFFLTIAEPLTTLVQKQRKFAWNKECQNVFEKAKSLLLLATILKAHNFEIKLQVDVSEIGIGTVLLLKKGIKA